MARNIYQVVTDRESVCGRNGYPFAVQDSHGQVAKFHNLDDAESFADMLERREISEATETNWAKV